MKKNSRVKVVKRSDNVGELNARNCKSVLQAQCSEAGLLHGLQCGGRDIGKQITEFLPALAASRKRVVPAQKKSEIILQTAIYRVGKSEGKRFRGSFARWNTALKWTLALQKNTGPAALRRALVLRLSRRRLSGRLAARNEWTHRKREKDQPGRLAMLEKKQSLGLPAGPCGHPATCWHLILIQRAALEIQKTSGVVLRIRPMFGQE